jgi:hypothetical protein
MKETIRLLERWLKEWKKDSCEDNERLMADTMRFIRKLNTERLATKKEEILDKYLHEFVMTFCPATEAEKIIYANAAALTNEFLEVEYKERIDDEVKKFILEDNRDGKTV